MQANELAFGIQKYMHGERQKGPDIEMSCQSGSGCMTSESRLEDRHTITSSHPYSVQGPEERPYHGVAFRLDTWKARIVS